MHAEGEAPGTAPIDVVGVVKRFAGRTALDDVSVRVGEGEVVVLLGPNGAGKTTLLRVLSGMTVPDRGRAFVAGYDVVRDRRRAATAAGVVGATEHTWYLRLSTLQNLEFFAALLGLPARLARAEAVAALADVGLLDEADKPVGACSRGMRARLAIARAWLGRPPVLLMDEPTAGLDTRSTADFIHHLRRREQRAVLLSTHSAAVAAELGDRAVVLNRGQVIDELTRPFDAGDVDRALHGALTWR